MMDSKERTQKFSIQIIKFVDSFPKDTSLEIIAKQLVRSATSVGANVVEAQASSSKKEFINFFHHALKSANETKYWLELLRDSNKKINVIELGRCLADVIEIIKILSSSLLTLKGQKKFYTSRAATQ